MLKFTTHIITMLSLGTALYILARTLPRIDDTKPKKITLENHWLSSHLEKVDKRIKKSTEKFLRKTGITLLKMQNKVDKKIANIKKEIPRQNILPLENPKEKDENPSVEK